MNYLQYKRLRDAASEVHEIKEKLEPRQADIEQHLAEIDRRQERMETRQDILQTLVEYMLKRGRGRPTKEEAGMLQDLVGRLHGETH